MTYQHAVSLFGAEADDDGEEVSAHHVLINHAGSKNTFVHNQQGAHKLCRDIIGRLRRAEKAGTSMMSGFFKEAMKHSDCGGSAAAGGSVGKFGRGRMAQEFEEAAFALQKNELSGIVDTQFGSHIIWKTGGPVEKPSYGDEVSACHILVKWADHDGEKNTEITTKAQAHERCQEIIDDLKRGYYPRPGAPTGRIETPPGAGLLPAFRTAALEYSECGSSQAGGFVGKFGRGRMAQEFEDAAYGLEKYELSGIVDTQFGSHIILKTGGPCTNPKSGRPPTPAPAPRVAPVPAPAPPPAAVEEHMPD